MDMTRTPPVGRMRADEVVVALDQLPRAVGAAPHGGAEDVVLAPQHALGHARGAAGVEDVEVVGGAARPGGARAPTTPGPPRSRRAPGSSVVARLVGHLEEHGRARAATGSTRPAPGRRWRGR